MKRNFFFLMLSVCAGAGVPCCAVGPPEFPRWGYSVRGGGLHQFKTDLDGGGSFAVDRYYAQGGVSRMWRFDRQLSLSAGFGADDYRFSGPVSNPWKPVENYRLSLFSRWGLENGWTLFGGPSVRAYLERGAGVDDALSAAFFGGASYRFSDRLSLGPGIGVVGQLADGPRWFPVLLVNWDITERLRLETGGGLAATGGPGLSLKYTFSRHWKAALGVRYEKMRFRLGSDHGPYSDGVGENRNIPIIGTVSYYLYPRGFVSAVFGSNISGEMRVENQNGVLVGKDSYDNSPFAGLSVSFLF